MTKKNLLNFNNAIILLFILAVIAIAQTVVNKKTSKLEQEANIVLEKLTDGNEISLISSEELVVEKVRNFDALEYNEAKNMLGIKSDFCIYFEDISGNVVKIDNVNLGIGSDKININGEPCR